TIPCLISIIRLPPTITTLFPYTTLFRSHKYLQNQLEPDEYARLQEWADSHPAYRAVLDRISTQGRFTADLAEFHHLPINEKRTRSEEHTSELQSRENLVCRLLLEKKKIK